MTFEQFQEEYVKIGTEGHNLLPYRQLLEHAKENKEQVKLHAGFIPRTFAKKLVKEGEEMAIKAAVELDYIDSATKSL